MSSFIPQVQKRAKEPESPSGWDYAGMIGTGLLLGGSTGGLGGLGMGGMGLAGGMGALSAGA